MEVDPCKDELMEYIIVVHTCIHLKTHTHTHTDTDAHAQMHSHIHAYKPTFMLLTHTLYIHTLSSVQDVTVTIYSVRF